jgi:hypothetical protein
MPVTTFHIKGHFAVTETVRNLRTDTSDGLLGWLAATVAFTPARLIG